MSLRALVWLIVVAASAAAGSFLVTWAASPARPASAATQPAVAQWLGLTPAQTSEIDKDDPDFDADAARLRADRQAQRQALAALLEQPAAPDGQIAAQVEKAIAADAALDRRVARHILAVRHHLSSEQQKRLMGLFAEGVRGGPGRGRGPGGGHGVGMGRGMGGPAPRGGAAGEEGCGANCDCGRRGGGAGGPPAASQPTGATHGGGRGRGRGWGAQGGRDGGPAAAGHQPPAIEAAGSPHEAIQTLFEKHRSIGRTVEEVPGGVVTTTTSDDPAVAALIRQHVRQMRERLEAGHGMRWFDPLFRELFARHDQIQLRIEEVPGGMRVTGTSDDPDAVRLIRLHARAVSGFVREGPAIMHQPTTLPADYRPRQ